MKKNFVLFSLFCLTLILAIVGLTTQKTRASIWGDDSPWMEVGEGTGQERMEQVRCTRTTTIHDTHTAIWNEKPAHLHDNTTVTEVWYGTAIFCDYANVMLSSCNPSTPCY